MDNKTDNVEELFPDKENEKNTNIIDIKSTQKTELMDIDTFLALGPVFCQRETRFRIKKIKKILLKGYLPQHIEVDIFEYPDDTRVIGNANTRRDIWEEWQTANEGCVPSHVSATIHNVKNDEEARTMYFTYDSDESVEKTADKITGVYRALDLKFENPTSKIAKGHIVKALEFASNQRASNPTNTRSSYDMFEIVSDFQNELKVFDSYGITIGNNHTLTAFLMALKLYGCDDPKLKRALERLRDEEKYASSKKGTDGITKMIEECKQNSIFPDGFKTDSITFPRQLDFFLYCIDKYRSDEQVTRFRRPAENGKVKRGARANLYWTWWGE